MIQGKGVIVLLPAYNAEETLQRTVGEITREVVDEIILVDDASSDHLEDRPSPAMARQP